MTEEERFCEAVASVSPDASDPLLLRLVDWDALPLTVRIADKLAAALALTSDLQTELANDDAAPLAWIVPPVDEVFARIATILQRLAS